MSMKDMFKECKNAKWPVFKYNVYKNGNIIHQEVDQETIMKCFNVETIEEMKYKGYEVEVAK